MGKRVKFYLRNLPRLAIYHIAVSLVLYAIGKGLKYLAVMLIQTTGRVAVTSGDFKFLFTTWQGWVIIFIGLAVLMLFVAFDINSKISYSSYVLKNEKRKVLSSFKEGLLSVKKFLNPLGILIVVYIGVISPMIGGAVTISLTGDLYIPKFISSVIFANPVLTVLFILVVLAGILAAFIYMLSFQGMMIDDLTLLEAMKRSRKLVLRNFRDYLKETIIYYLLFIPPLLLFAALLLLSSVLIPKLPVSVETERFILGSVMSFFFLSGALVLYADLPGYILFLNRAYYKYTGRIDEIDNYENPKKPKGSFYIALIVIVLLLSVATGFVSRYLFDYLFPNENNTQIIAHRAGGNDGVENTVSGLKKAIEAGAYGAEIDIQRTSDGYYVVNHDDTFSRVADDGRKPGEMTLSECKKLKVFGKEEVATLEEMLEASRGNIILFIELKGETADEQMADDTVRIVREMGMQDEVCLISLKYDIIQYIEEKYPEMNTSFLTFLSLGDTQSLRCDSLGLEEESASSDMIYITQSAGKKVLVWTPNEDEDITEFLKSDADAIITDNIIRSVELREELKDRDDVEKVMDIIYGLFD